MHSDRRGTGGRFTPPCGPDVEGSERPFAMIDLCMNRRAMLAGLAPLAVGVAGTGAAAQAAKAPRLRTSGNRLLLGDEPVRLRGVVVGDLLKPGRPALFPYRDIARTWGANAVRISVHPGYWNADTPGARRRVADNVRAARAAGLFVILCWHALGFPGGFTFRPPATWGTRADAFDTSIAKCRAFWSEMAELYAPDGGIAFELFNEPIRDPRNPDVEYRLWPRLRAVWTDIVGTVIRPRADNVVICSGNRYSYDLRGIAEAPVESDNIAYAWHVYPRQGRQSLPDWLVRLDNLQKHRPVIVTEWGFAQVGDPQFLATPQSFADPLLRLLDANGMSWFAYSFSPRAQPSLVEKDWKTPTAYGRYVIARLAESGAA